MAITQDILVAMRINSQDNASTITLANTNPRFPKRTIEIDTSNPKRPVDIDSKTLGTSRILLILTQNGAITSKQVI